ncbi:MAG: DUF4230 domain-containing protein [Firmicutes bacterium]|nr:DUF4230 domain-containing protein [Bacillota bacterium]
MKKFFNTILLMIGCLVVGFIAGKVVDVNILGGSSNTYKIETIEEQMTEISELSVLEYKYTNTDEMSGDNALKVFGKSVPFTSKSMVVMYDGVMKIGPDMSAAKVKLKGDKLTIVIPHSEILSHEIDEESWQILDKKNGLFNAVTPEDSNQLRKELVKKMTQHVKKSDKLSQADEMAVKQIKAFFEAAYPDLKVKVVFPDTADAVDDSDDDEDKDLKKDEADA